MLGLSSAQETSQSAVVWAAGTSCCTAGEKVLPCSWSRRLPAGEAARSCPELLVCGSGGFVNVVNAAREMEAC